MISVLASEALTALQAGPIRPAMLSDDSGFCVGTGLFEQLTI